MDKRRLSWHKFIYQDKLKYTPQATSACKMEKERH